MRVAVLVLSIIGGVFGAFWGIVALAFGGIGNSVEDGSGDAIVAHGAFGILTAGLGILIGCLFFGGVKRTWMAIGLVLITLAHLISIGYAGIPGGLFLGIAAILAFFARKPEAPPLVMVQPVGVPGMGPTGVQGFMASTPALPESGVYCSVCGRPGQESGKYCAGCGNIVR